MNGMSSTILGRYSVRFAELAAAKQMAERRNFDRDMPCPTASSVRIRARLVSLLRLKEVSEQLAQRPVLFADVIDLPMSLLED
jgi:hypothetical protein